MKNAGIVAIIYLMCYCNTIVQVSNYKAAVVEYAPIRELRFLPREVVEENAKKYVELIEDAASKGANIVIFPECGLTTLEVNMKVPHHLESYSVEIPKVEEDVFTCNSSQDQYQYHRILNDISSVAKNRSIYVVINVVEREPVEGSKTNFTFFNANVVFNQCGVIIKKQRKINLYKEQYFSSGTEEISSFTTEFEVTFGLLIGTDILYKNATEELLKNSNITDVIYSTAWSSETPFLNGLSIQDGFAKRNNINLLAACLSDPSHNSTGSGIFLKDGTIAGVHISAVQNTKLLIRDVSNETRPIVKTCQIYDEELDRAEDKILTYESPIQTAIEDLQHYDTKLLDYANNETEVCSGGFCCFFTISTDATSSSNYTYRLVAFFGSRIFGSQTIAVSSCAVVACLDENIISCGGRATVAPTIEFKQITIKATYSKQEELYIQPITLKYNLHPVVGYKYCTSENKTSNEIKVNITTAVPQESLLTFGFFGRVYDQDNQKVGKLKYDFERKLNIPEEASNNVVLVVIVALAIVILIVILITFYTSYYRKHRERRSSSAEMQEFM